MKPLIYKMFTATGAVALPIISVLFFFPSLLQFNGELNIVQGTALFFFSGLIPLIICSDDTKSNWNKYCPVLPISRKAVVSTSFVLTLIFNFLQLIFSTVFAIIGAETIGDGFSFVYIAELMACYIIGSAIAGVLLIVMFKYSHSVAFFFCGLLYAFGGFFTGFSAGFFGDNPTAVNFITDGRVYAVLAVISAALFVLEWFISVRIYSKKDL